MCLYNISSWYGSSCQCQYAFNPPTYSFEQILVWHTQTKSNSPANRTVAASGRYRGTNIERLQDFLV